MGRKTLQNIFVELPFNSNRKQPMGYLKIFTFLNFKTRSSQMVLLQKCISYFWEKGGQGLLPMGRVTVSRGCPQHGLRCRTALKDLNTTETRAYNWVCCWPQHSKQWTTARVLQGDQEVKETRPEKDLGTRPEKDLETKLPLRHQWSFTF